ncbi:isoleucyl-tRNA synthetase [Marasmius fiardii PR-910]|nr:isoleucyl-tRNA synthetase [Marasmius fiardii PR-910]
MIVRSLQPLPISQRSFPTVLKFSSFCTTRTRTQEKLDSRSFSKTLQLPKTSFPLWSDPIKVEKPLRTRTSEELYRWQYSNAKGHLFVFHDGPPYANGDLHMGHALNKILKDIINRFHVLQGRKVHYVPGWDCHGLPIENKSLQELGKDSINASPNTIRKAAYSTATREIASQKVQFKEFGIMADWDSDSSTYRTLDHRYEMRQLQIFRKMVEKGLIYRHYRPVHYSPSSRSALAEAELVYKDDHVSHSVYVTFELDKRILGQRLHPLQGLEDSQLLVWTTTPWTLTANMGIAVNPDLTYAVLKIPDGDQKFITVKDRIEALNDILGPTEVIREFSGSDLVGLTYIPIFASSTGFQNQTPLPIISAGHVTADSGTGLVHCAPAHGAEDYHAFRSLGLIPDASSIRCHVDGSGSFSAAVAEVIGDSTAKALVGQPVLEGGSRGVVELLKEMGKVVKVKRFKHRYPYDWKTDKPIIVTATSQWFANLDSIKDKALAALERVQFFPPICTFPLFVPASCNAYENIRTLARNRLEAFIRSRSEWCISRQRVWGVPIPALYYNPTDTAVLNASSLDHILGVLEAKGVDYWWDGPVEDFVPPALKNSASPQEIRENWRKGTDTMDVWFDSGSSWSMLGEMGVSRRGYEADICLEGSDQHRGWFQSQLLTYVSVALDDGSPPAAPYRTLITHGMVLDESGKKMSKSLGNIISPLVVIRGGKDKKKEPAYGADILRLWAATMEYWQDMSIGPTVLAQTAESMRKIRNSARFMLGNIGDKDAMERVPRSEFRLAERWIMHELFTLERIALEGYAAYNFPKVMNALINFCNITLSSLYFDIAKDCLYANAPGSIERRGIVTVLEKILDTVTTVLAPVLPHLAEEINQAHLRVEPSVFAKKWTPLTSEWEDATAHEEMKTLLHIRKSVLGLLEKARSAKQLKSSLEAEVDIIIPEDLQDNGTLELLRREEDFLKTLFIVSDASLTEEGSLGSVENRMEWVHSTSIEIPGLEQDIGIRIRPASLSKCPRCWTFTREEGKDLCPRCELVLTE